MAFQWAGDRVDITSDSNSDWDLSFTVPPFAPKGERKPVQIYTPWDGPMLNVWRMFHPEAPDEEYATQGFLFERPSDKMGVLLFITQGAVLVRAHVAIWMPENELQGKQWTTTYPLTVDDFLGQLVRLQSGTDDDELFPSEWLEKMKDAAQLKAHSEAGTR